MTKKSLLLVLVITMIISKSQSQSNIYTPELLWKLGRISELQLSPDGKTLLFGITYYDVEKNKGSRNIWTMSVDGSSLKKITDTEPSEQNAVWRPDGKKIGFLFPVDDNMQLFEMNPDGTDRQQISHIKGGIEGFKYANDMSKILFTQSVKLDKNAQDIHQDMPKANVLIADDLMYRHWNAWTNYSYSHVFIADYPNMKNIVDIMENERFASPIPNFGGMEEINFSPDGRKIAYTCKKKVGKEFSLSTNSDIYIYDIENKTTTNISAPNAGYDIDPVFSPNGTLLSWVSMQTDGFESDKSRIFIHDFNTHQTTNFSADFDASASNFVFSKDEKILYFLSVTKGTTQIFALNIAKKQINMLTQGQHNYHNICVANNCIYALRESMQYPADVFVVDLKKKTQTQLTCINKDLLQNIASIDVKERWITTTDGKQMLVWVILPPNFDSTKKYPAVLYCQGGPQSAVSQFFSYRWNFQVMASRGYVVVAPNRRGVPGFGQEWVNQISLDYGGQNMNDYLSAIDNIAQEPYIDADKLGCVGASYGGFSVYWLAGHHQKRFKAFIAHCAMFNFKSWYATTDELFFANHDLGGAFWENPQPQSYDFSPNNFVEKWDTPIMVIHGGNDFRIPYTEGLQAFNIAQMKGIPSRLLYFPEETHFVVKPQNSIVWHREFLNWLDKFLK